MKNKIVIFSVVLLVGSFFLPNKYSWISLNMAGGAALSALVIHIKEN